MFDFQQFFHGENISYNVIHPISIILLFTFSLVIICEIKRKHHLLFGMDWTKIEKKISGFKHIQIKYSMEWKFHRTYCYSKKNIIEFY